MGLSSINKFHTLFTNYDDSVTGESGRDPLGLQIIWSYFGQQIFGNQITSISNDVRNFTISLFHHYVVRSLVEDYSLVLEKTPFSEIFESKDAPFFKASVLMFLENLLIYTVHSMPAGKFDSEGLLGSASAVHKWRSQDENPLLLMHPSAGILARQISLGINGRYKTPLVQCGFFDYNYTYGLRGNGQVWAKAEDLFSKWKKAAELKQVLVQVIRDVLSGVFITRKKAALQAAVEKTRKAYAETGIRTDEDLAIFPFTDFDSVAEEFPDLPGLYASVFGRRDRWGARVSGLWKTLLGFTSGAAGSLYTSIETGEEDYGTLCARALSLEGDETERTRISHILTIEPLLGLMDYLFHLVNAREIRRVGEVGKELKRRGFYQALSKLDSEGILVLAEGVTSTIAGRRLEGLLKIPQYAGDVSSMLRALADYHASVMDFRGLFPWFSITDDGSIRHAARMYSLSSLDRRRPDDWVHGYYLDAMVSLWMGLEAVR